MDELLKLKQAIAHLEDREVRQLLLLLFMKAEQPNEDYGEQVIEIAHALIDTFKEQAREISVRHVHIVFDKQVAGSLKRAFKRDDMLPTEAIIFVPDILSIGPVTEVHTLRGIERRYDWLSENLRDANMQQKKQGFIQAIQEIQTIKNREKVFIWTGQNAHEQTGMRIALALLQNHMNDMVLIDSFHAFHHVYDFPVMQEQGLPQLTAELIPEQLIRIYKEIHHIGLTNDERGRLCEEGFEILASDNRLRSFIDSRIVLEDETRDDVFLLSFIRDYQQGEGCFVPAKRIITGFLSEMPHYTGARWLDYRLRALIANGSLQYEGDLSTSSLYSVK